MGGGKVAKWLLVNQIRMLYSLRQSLCPILETVFLSQLLEMVRYDTDRWKEGGKREEGERREGWREGGRWKEEG